MGKSFLPKDGAIGVSGIRGLGKEYKSDRLGIKRRGQTSQAGKVEIKENIVEKIKTVEREVPVEKVVRAAPRIEERVVTQERLIYQLGPDDRAMIAEWMSKVALMTMENNRLRYRISKLDEGVTHFN